MHSAIYRALRITAGVLVIAAIMFCLWLTVTWRHHVAIGVNFDCSWSNYCEPTGLNSIDGWLSWLKAVVDTVIIDGLAILTILGLIYLALGRRLHINSDYEYTI